MSSQILKLIPTDPQYVPDGVAQQVARQLLVSFIPQADEISVRVADEVQFVDQGGYWERVLCPVCGTELDPLWWREVMEAAYTAHFSRLTVAMPCCQQTCSLNDLVYEWPAGFARFILEILNPGVDLGSPEIRELETWLRCDLRKIWAHY